MAREVTETYTVYRFRELQEGERNKAINNYINGLLEILPYENHPWKDAIDEAERLHTPWFTSAIVWERYQGDILEALEEYEYCEDGSIYD